MDAHDNNISYDMAALLIDRTMTKIVGHGIDIIELREFEILIERSGEHFVSRCFTEHERSYAADGPNRTARLAVRFVAKEAVLKAVARNPARCQRRIVSGWTTRDKPSRLGQSQVIYPKAPCHNHAAAYGMGYASGRY